ncbi:MAG: hypothetical protein JSS20_18955, partial [Proteobacteria bacterium]|nr:hypothetical protein [Pseudomonadota bacterium]
MCARQIVQVAAERVSVIPGALNAMPRSNAMARLNITSAISPAALAAVATLSLSSFALAAEPLGNQAAPAAIAADIPIVAAEPAIASDSGRRGASTLLPSGTVDLAAGTVTVPLHQGRMKSGETVWYVLLDTNDRGQAEALGLNYAPKLTFADIGKAVRSARLDASATLVFDAGKVDFKPERKVVPGAAPNFFPPTAASPGSVGDADYTPLVKIVNAGGHIYNAPVVA